MAGQNVITGFVVGLVFTAVFLMLGLVVLGGLNLGFGCSFGITFRSCFAAGVLCYLATAAIRYPRPRGKS